MKICEKLVPELDAGQNSTCTTCALPCPFATEARPTYLIPEEGLKKDQDKLRYDLFPVEALEEITWIINFGAKKYAPRAWERGMSWGRLYAALFRHMTAWWGGEDLDQETGASHLAHAGACIVFLMTYVRRGMVKWDDRPRKDGQAGRDLWTQK